MNKFQKLVEGVKLLRKEIQSMDVQKARSLSHAIVDLQMQAARDAVDNFYNRFDALKALTAPVEKSSALKDAEKKLEEAMEAYYKRPEQSNQENLDEEGYW